MKNQLSGSANIIIHTFLRRLQITLLHLIRRACLIPLLVTGDSGFSPFPSFSFLGFGSLVSLATTEKSEIEINHNELRCGVYFFSRYNQNAIRFNLFLLCPSMLLLNWLCQISIMLFYSTRQKK